MNWYTWTSTAAFDAWHATVIDGLGLPRIGRNQASGQLQPAKQATVAYTSVVEVAVDDWRALVDDAIASSFVVGLGVVCDPPVFESDL